MVIGRRARSEARSSARDHRPRRGERALDAPGQERHDVVVGADLPVGELLDQQRRRAARRPAAPIRTGQAVSRRERRSGRRRPQPATGAAAVSSRLPPRSATRFQRWNSCASSATSSASSTTQASAGRSRAQRLAPAPTARAPRSSTAPARSAQILARWVLPQAAGPISRQAGAGPGGPAQDGVQRLAVASRRHEVGQLLARGVRQVQHELARRRPGRRLASRRRAAVTAATRASTQIRPAA